MDISEIGRRLGKDTYTFLKPPVSFALIEEFLKKDLLISYKIHDIVYVLDKFWKIEFSEDVCLDEKKILIENFINACREE